MGMVVHVHVHMYLYTHNTCTYLNVHVHTQYILYLHTYIHVHAPVPMLSGSTDAVMWYKALRTNSCSLRCTRWPNALVAMAPLKWAMASTSVSICSNKKLCNMDTNSYGVLLMSLFCCPYPSLSPPEHSPTPSPTPLTLPLA